MMRLLTAFVLVAFIAAPAGAIPSFPSGDNRLPNPDRPYEMTGGTVSYESSPHFALYDLEFAPSDPSQLDIPTRNPDGSHEFDSTFDINYKAVVSFSTQPPSTVTGIGTARARGFAPGDSFHGPGDFIFPNPQVFETELVELNLLGLSPIEEVMLRESPTLHSPGVIIRDNQCLVCASAAIFWRISSFFDAFTEVTFNGGHSWTPADRAIHLEQAPEPFPPGDYNHDHVVDAGDYITWRQSLGQIGAGLAADGDWSGAVDEGDYDVWRSHFGETSASSSLSTAVPEPATALLLTTLAGFPLLLRREPRARCRV